MENNPFIAFNVFTHILMPHHMIILYLHLPYFHVSNSALCFTLYTGTLLLLRRSLDTFYGKTDRPRSSFNIGRRLFAMYLILDISFWYIANIFETLLHTSNVIHRDCNFLKWKYMLRVPQDLTWSSLNRNHWDIAISTRTRFTQNRVSESVLYSCDG